jgi:hypothetical protein
MSKHHIDVISRALGLGVIFHLLFQMNYALFDPHPTARVSWTVVVVVVLLGALLVVVVPVLESMLGSLAKAGHTIAATTMLAMVWGFIC